MGATKKAHLSFLDALDAVHEGEVSVDEAIRELVEEWGEEFAESCRYELEIEATLAEDGIDDDVVEMQEDLVCNDDLTDVEEDEIDNLDDSDDDA